MNQNSKRLGGCLVLLGFQLIATVGISIYELIQFYDILQSPGWERIQQLDKLSAFKTIIYFEIGMHLLILMVTPIILGKYFNRKRGFKDYYSTYIVFIVIILAIDYLLNIRIDSIPESKIDQISNSFFSYIIWGIISISYLHKNKRPGMTFIN